MAAINKWECSSCDFKVVTSGSHEFYRDEKGEFHPYGHPTAGSTKAIEAGVKGFCVRGYCTKCNAVKVAITREFKTLVHEGWWHKSDNEEKRIKPICSECGNELILDFVEKPCPKCGGIFSGVLSQNEWVR